MIDQMKLTNKELNFVVAYLEGIDVNNWCETSEDEWQHSVYSYCPSEDWHQGGDIIEREKICIEYINITETKMWRAHNGRVSVQFSTPLVAAMHCYVMDKLGREVDMKKIYESLQVDIGVSDDD
jgi:hypothetical protein